MRHEKQRCEQCRYFDPVQGSPNGMRGFCRRNAPKPMQIETGFSEQGCGFTGFWPLLYAKDWCGEWEGE